MSDCGHGPNATVIAPPAQVRSRKTVAIVGSTKKLIQTMNMQSLQELRSVQKPESVLEDTLAAVIMICNN